MMRIAQRMYHFFQRVLRESKQFPRRTKNFGLKVSLATFWDGLIPPGKNQHYIKTIEEYVDAYMKPLTNFYSTQSVLLPASQPAPKIVPVWCCWWQGVENLPELVAMCNQRLEQVLPRDKTELHMITLDNYKNYVDIPDYIIRKFEHGLMSMTALSDVLRVMLLRKYGGFWIDSTVLISDNFPIDFISGKFFTQKMYDPDKWRREACKGRWCGFLMAGPKEHIIFRYLEDAFLQWWKDYDCVIDYVILDYFLLAAYKTVTCIKEEIDSVPDNNIDIFEMYKVLHLPYSQELMARLRKNNTLHKLTYKIDLIRETLDGQQTLYGYLLDAIAKHTRKL